MTDLKPNWALQSGQDSIGSWLEFEQQNQIWRVYLPKWHCVLQHDTLGLYMDLVINGVTQRCRWLPPGSFSMGSPLTEHAHHDNEVQHQTTLSKGFWLADSACTQALWQAVTGQNPAFFKDNSNNPVEQVSWDDVQIFLKQVNNLIPGLKAKLPSEAQWEYACRAGTTGPFWFGTDVTPEQVNYDGRMPYAHDKKGLCREQTVAVKSLPANAWGLYEMHGNVWEWCADWHDDFSAQPALDPTGSETGSARILRGGSWCNHAWRTRSANRGWYVPVNRDNYIGFRFALFS